MPSPSTNDLTDTNPPMVNNRPRESAGHSKSLKRNRPDVIEISSDEDGDSTKATDHHRAKIGFQQASHVPPFPSSPKPASVLSDKPERYKLECARLARRQAREIGSNPTASSSTSIPSASPQAVQVPQQLEPSRSDLIHNYWHSTIKVTFNHWYPHHPNAFRIEDIIGPKNRIKKALVSSYVVELPWVHGLFDPKTPLMVIRHHTECGSFKVNERQNMFLCHPPMLKTAKGTAHPGCMHIKFFIIFYDNFCRVAIPTANAVSFDYEIIENAVWIQDFKCFNGNTMDDNSRPAKEVPPFRKTLEDLLERMGVPDPFRKPLADHDFRPAAANLVLSVQGSHAADAPFGQTGLARELKNLRLQSGDGTGRTATLECQGSSIGSYDLKWINNFYRCASGSTPTCGSVESDVKSASSTPPLSVLYPSLHTVKNSKNGKAGAGTLFCNKASWEKANFPRDLFKDTLSKRLGVLMHVKMILGLFNLVSSIESSGSRLASCLDKPTAGEAESTNKDHVGFLYIGSHNFTPAAWGRFTWKSGSRHSSSLEISNWEMGVVLPLKSLAQAEEYVSWQRPLKAYGHGGKDSWIPWMQFSHGG